MLQVGELFVQQAIFFVNWTPNWGSIVSRKGFNVIQKVNQDVVLLIYFAILTILVLNAPFFIILWAIDLDSFRLLKATENVFIERLRELVRASGHNFLLKNALLLLGLVDLGLPEKRHVLLIALTHGTLIVVAQTLLGPERALTF